jgi:hypothetical protein
MWSRKSVSSLLVVLALAVGAVVAGSGLVGAQHGQHMQAKQQGKQPGPHMHRGNEAAMPTMPGQDTFGAIQEIVQILEADPATDWSKVNIAALREHLIDMNEVALRAVATERPMRNGVEIVVTGEGRTGEAIKRMVPAHAKELGGIGWNATTEELANGVKLVVTSADATQATKLRALGFMGIMVQGGHHQPHHLMIAKGERHGH